MEVFTIDRAGLWAGSGNKHPPASASAPAEQDRDRALAGLGVLIVEDEGLVALDLERILLQAGCSVLAVVDTERDAIRAAERLRPDVVLMDIALSEGDGIAAASTIREAYDVPVIFVSGNTDRGTVARAAQAEPAGFVRKPFNETQLVRALQDAIGVRR